MSSEIVGDEEQLYRRIPVGKDYIKDETDAKGLPKISSQAFGDRDMRVSVYRSELIGHNPELTKVEPTDAAAALLTNDVRKIGEIPAGPGTKAFRTIDVIADPRPIGTVCPADPAHALIVADPDFQDRDGKHFKKLKQALARLATGVIPPSRESCRSDSVEVA